jgi:predicted AAA+ superfamily ATPase
MPTDLKDKKRRVLEAAELAVEELINVLKEKIVSFEDDLSADKMKNAAAAKRLAFEDAIIILDKIQEERDKMNVVESTVVIPDTSKGGFAENRGKK